ncbi:MAG: FAD binding domain-containing protein [Actinobacteria bacterium]|nr:FAD binding domain-containing protein [Actinomycetota bacterium]
MKPPPFDYHVPATVDEAVALRTADSDAVVLAGGQSLVPLLNMRLARPSALIDLRCVGGLSYVRAGEGGVAVGAMTRQRELERSAEAFEACPILREALELVGHPPIRNRGTVGGSIAHADPAAELPAVLCVLGGRVGATGPRGTREIAADDFFLYPFTTSLEPDEVLTEVFFPKAPSGSGYAALELTRRHGDFALAGVCAVVSNGSARLCFTGVGGRPVLVDSDEPDAWQAAIDPSADATGSADYRRQLVAVLGRRALELARARSAQ